MSIPGDRLREVVARAAPRLERLSDEEAARPHRPGKWTRKQILGHLIDSASNNHQRFVRAQLGGDFVFPGYEQERWVEMQRYADAPWSSLLPLWREFNLQIARVMDAVPETLRLAPQTKHNFHRIAFKTVPEDQPVTLEYLMDDYVDHLEHHLRQFGAEL
jgi:hypothetical protein